MRTSRQFLIALSLVVLPLARSAAQTCQGGASFANGRTRIGANAQFDSRATSYVGQATFGAPKNWYASALVGRTRYEGSSTSQTDVGGKLGFQIPVGASGTEFCPYGILGYSSLPGATNRTTWGFGGGIGFPIKAGESMDFVPALGIQWQSTSGSSSALSTTNNTLLWLNAGVVLGKAWSVTPGVIMPTRSGQDNVLTLGLGYNW
jgi:hypothetical protein